MRAPLPILLLTVAVGAQAHEHAVPPDGGARDSLSAMATGLATRVSPATAGLARTEALIAQPMLMARDAHRDGALRYAIMLSAEQWTMPGGEPVAGLWGEGFIDAELQVSAATLRSPEFVTGGRFDQRKWSASARWTPVGTPLRYLLAEWARTEDRYRDRSIAGYGSRLTEALAERGSFSAALKVEQTPRREEELVLDSFRTARPPADLTMLGITRWKIATAHIATAQAVRPATSSCRCLTRERGAGVFGIRVFSMDAVDAPPPFTRHQDLM